MIPLYSILVIIIMSCTQPNEVQQLVQPEIVSVKVTGSEDNYTFSVGIKSPDLGCEQYADWWEVVSLDGVLIYRRVLGHSHVEEQPFVRSGGVVSISSDQEIIVRAHMNTTGYGKSAFKGTVNKGFTLVRVDSHFASHVEKEAPQPSSCAF